MVTRCGCGATTWRIQIHSGVQLGEGALAVPRNTNGVRQEWADSMVHAQTQPKANELLGSTHQLASDHLAAALVQERAVLADVQRSSANNSASCSSTGSMSYANHPDYAPAYTFSHAITNNGCNIQQCQRCVHCSTCVVRHSRWCG